MPRWLWWFWQRRYNRRHHHCCRPPLHFTYTLGPTRPKKGPTPMPLELTITTEQKINVAVHPVTATGQPAALDGAPAWVVSGGDSTLAIAADGLSSDLISSSLPGDTTYIVSADADLGAGVVTISDTILLHVLGAQATALGLVAGTAVPK